MTKLSRRKRDVMLKGKSEEGRRKRRVDGREMKMGRSVSLRMKGRWIERRDEKRRKR